LNNSISDLKLAPKENIVEKQKFIYFLSILTATSLFLKTVNAEPIHDAARKGDIAQIQQELAKGVDVNLQTKNGVTALMRAANGETLKFLISKGANPNHQDKNGNTALYWLASDKNTDKLKILLDNGADPQIKNGFGQTALFATNTKEATEILIAKGLDLDLVDNLGTTPLSRKANSLDKEDILELLIAHGADVNGKGKQVPLIQAAMGGREKHAEILIKHGADVNAQNDRKQTALHYPYKLATVKLLVSKGAHISALDRDGNTPLHNVHDPEIAKFLIAQGVDSKVKNKFGKTSWDVARLNLQKAEKSKRKEKIKKYKALLSILK